MGKSDHFHKNDERDPKWDPSRREEGPGFADGDSPQMMMSPMSISVNPSSVVVYADYYWQDYNPAYVAQTGDDCANFASQALFAGGWTMNQTGNYQNWDQWWHHSGGGVATQQQSWPWINAQMLSDFGV